MIGTRGGSGWGASGVVAAVIGISVTCIEQRFIYIQSGRTRYTGFNIMSVFSYGKRVRTGHFLSPRITSIPSFNELSPFLAVCFDRILDRHLPPFISKYAPARTVSSFCENQYMTYLFRQASVLRTNRSSWSASFRRPGRKCGAETQSIETRGNWNLRFRFTGAARCSTIGKHE